MTVQLPRLTRRAFVDLAVYMAAFGLLIGVVFPPCTLLLGVPAATALRPAFVAAALTAGVVVGTVNFVLARSVVGARLRRLATGLESMRSYFAAATDGDHAGDHAGDVDPARYQLPVDSTDELGSVAAAFNALIHVVARAHAVERAIAAASTAVARQVETTRMAEAALDVVLTSVGARGGAVLSGSARSLSVLARRNLAADLPADLMDLAAPGYDSNPRTVVPLCVGDSLVGALVLDLQEPERPGQRRLLAVLSDTLAVALANAELHARLRRQACIDDLTWSSAAT